MAPADVTIREWREADAAALPRLADDRAVWLGLRDAWLLAVPFARNVASARVLEKCGYRLEGTLRQSAIKDGVVLDHWMYAITRDDLDPR